MEEGGLSRSLTGGYSRERQQAEAIVQVGATIGTKKVEASGAAILAPADMDFTVRVETLSFRFHFINAEGEPAAEVVSQSADAATINLRAFNNPLGMSYVIPQVGNINGIPVGISLFISAAGSVPNITRLVNFCVVSG
jgi:hypothetical protein